MSAPNVGVCGFKCPAQEGWLRLAVSSRATVTNPVGWKDLWLLSPLSVVDGGVAVPGMAGVCSMTVENAWQFLKVWPDEDGWQREEALEAFHSTCAIRYPRGRGRAAKGHWWADAEQLIEYVEARRRIYVPAYLEMLRLPDRSALIERLREASCETPIQVVDPDSYSVEAEGLGDIAEAIDYTQRPFAHAFIVALAVQDRLEDLKCNL